MKVVLITLILTGGILVSRQALANELQPGRTERTRKIIENCYVPAEYLHTGENNSKTYKENYRIKEINIKADELTKNCKSSRDKVKAIHDWIVTNIKYMEDTTYTGYPMEDAANPYMVWKNKGAICYGYAQLTQIMLQHVKIPCITVRGLANVGNGLGSHVWNMVYVDGTWKFTDNTFDENYTEYYKQISYKYYLMDDEFYAENYITQFIENCLGDLCYYPIPVYKDKNWHVAYLNANGGKVSTSKVPAINGTTFGQLPTPTRKGWSFLGWFTSKNGKKEVIAQDKSRYPTTINYKTDVTLYAHWKRKSSESITNSFSKKKVKIRSVKKSKNKIYIRWNKLSKATGYYVYISNKKNGKYKKIGTVKAKKIKYKILANKLKKNRTYYFKVRAYRKVGKRKYLSKMSAIKRVRI